MAAGTEVDDAKSRMNQAYLHLIVMPEEDAGVVRTSVSECTPHPGTGLLKLARGKTIKRQYSGYATHVEREA
jgi:hypothetical protein